MYLIATACLTRAPCQLLTDGRMRDGFELLACARIRKYVPPHLRPIQRAGGVQNLRAKLLHKLRKRRRAGCYYISRNLIRVEYGDAVFGKQFRHGAFSARDAAREGDEQ